VKYLGFYIVAIVLATITTTGCKKDGPVPQKVNSETVELDKGGDTPPQLPPR